MEKPLQETTRNLTERLKLKILEDKVEILLLPNYIKLSDPSVRF